MSGSRIVVNNVHDLLSFCTTSPCNKARDITKTRKVTLVPDTNLNLDHFTKLVHTINIYFIIVFNYLTLKKLRNKNHL